MADIDEERLQTLMKLVNKEHPDLDPYVIWVICVNYLLNDLLKVYMAMKHLIIIY
jgi:hypothetical protein